MINLKIRHSLMIGLVEKIIANTVKKKLGLEAQINIGEMTLTSEGDMTKITFIGSASAPTTQLEELIKKNLH